MCWYTALLALALCGGHVGAQLFGVRSCNMDIPTKENFDVQQYLGKWYEVERYHPLFFEFGLTCGVAEYEINESGNIRVQNTGTNRLTGERGPVIGEAVILNRTHASKLYVSFSAEDSVLGGLFDELFRDDGNYWVLDTDYVSFAIVYSCVPIPVLGRTEIVWILGRTPTLPEETMTHIYDLLHRYNIKTKYLNTVDQNCGA